MNTDLYKIKGKSVKSIMLRSPWLQQNKLARTAAGFRPVQGDDGYQIRANGIATSVKSLTMSGQTLPWVASDLQAPGSGRNGVVFWSTLS
jgi:hypothetical protein